MAKRLLHRGARDYSPHSWLEYFDEAHDIAFKSNHNNDEKISSDSFRVYLKNFKPPFAPNRELGSGLNLKHDEQSQQELNQYSHVPTLVTIHGGGYSALTWAEFASCIDKECKCRILSLDLRGHGDTKTADDNLMDIDVLVEDVFRVVHAAHRICGFLETPKIILIGHSMGGAIAVKCATRSPEYLPSLAGFVVIDVVEGTAKDALPLMISVIQTRPKTFPSLSNAIEWSIRSGMAKNINAARVSMPGNLINIESEQLGIHDVLQPQGKEGLIESIKKHKFHVHVDKLIPNHRSPPILISRGLPLAPRVSALRSDSEVSIGYPRPKLGNSNDLDEITERSLDQAADDSAQSLESTSTEGCPSSDVDEDGYKKPYEVSKTGYCWRTDLAKTQPFWNGWFDGLSEQLLKAPVQGKFLLLAGIDRLDKTLTIGQMQGKFMMKVLPKCGHAVHEDVPHEVASVIAQFLVRNKFTTNAGVDEGRK